MSDKRCVCDKKDWVVVRYKFDLSKYENPSEREIETARSWVMCRNCGYHWRTNAKYVETLPRMKGE